MKKIFLVGLIFTIIAIAVTWTLVFGKEALSKYYISKDIDAEVLNWDSDKGELKVKIQTGSSVLTTTVPVNPPETTAFVKILSENEFGEEEPSHSVLSFPKNEIWTAAFCIGDTVRLTSDKFDISRVKIGQTLNVSFIQKTNNTICED